MQWLTVSLKYPNIFYSQWAGHFFDIIHVPWIECVTCLKIFERFLNLPFVPQNKTLKEIMMKCTIQAIFFMQRNTPIRKFRPLIQGDSVARGPKLFSIKNYVIEIMTWKFIYTYREWCKTGPAHNRCWNWSPFISKHTWMLFSKFWNTFPKFVWGL